MRTLQERDQPKKEDLNRTTMQLSSCLPTMMINSVYSRIYNMQELSQYCSAVLDLSVYIICFAFSVT